MGQAHACKGKVPGGKGVKILPPPMPYRFADEGNQPPADGWEMRLSKPCCENFWRSSRGEQACGYENLICYGIVPMWLS